MRLRAASTAASEGAEKVAAPSCELKVEAWLATAHLMPCWTHLVERYRRNLSEEKPGREIRMYARNRSRSVRDKMTV
jgi:hypothetical protein